MARQIPTFPTAAPSGGTPRPLRVRLPVRAEEEQALAEAAGHLSGWRCLRRFTHTISHPPELRVTTTPPGGTSPDGDTAQHIAGPWERGPFATHVAVVLTVEAAGEGASLDPEIALTLQWWDGMAWEDVDAPDAEGGGPGVLVEAEALDREAAATLLTIRAEAPEPAPSAYPTVLRALNIPDAIAAGDRLRLVIDVESVRVWHVAVRELRAGAA